METLLYFVFWAGLFFLMMRLGCGAHVTGHGHGQVDKDARRHSDRLRWVPPGTDIDPVCGQTVIPHQAKSTVHDGMVYYFCSRECREIFEAAPDLYVGPAADRKAKELDHAHG